MCLVAQSCLTFCDPMGFSLPNSSVHEVFPTIILEWVAISSSWGSSLSRDWKYISCVSFIGRWILYHCATWELYNNITLINTKLPSIVFKTLLLNSSFPTSFGIIYNYFWRFVFCKKTGKEEEFLIKNKIFHVFFTDIFIFQIRNVQISRSVMSDSATPWIAACQASLSITISRS